MKHNYFKHLFTALLLLCTTVATAYDFKADGFIFNITDSVNKTVEIAAKIRGVHYTNDIVIPEEVTFKDVTYSVTGIGERAFDSCTGLTSITIPNSVTSIGYQAFYGCTGLTSIEIPNSVTSIGNEAFAYCTGLKSAVIGNRVTSIGEMAFYGCLELKKVINLSALNIYRSSDNGYVAYYATVIINAPNGIVDRDFIFRTVDGANILVTYIGNDTTLVLPDDYKGESYCIGEKAFRDFTELASITIPNNVTSIGYQVFSGCTGLKEVHISDLAAWCNIDFADLWDSNPLYNAHNLYLNGEMVTDLVIPEGVANIKPFAFSGCTCLISVTIPNSVTSIGESVFSGCTGLKEVHISDLAAWCNIDFADLWDSNPLYNAHNLYLNGEMVTDLVIPEGVANIKPFAFSGCTCLINVTTPNSVTSIGGYAFSGCTGLTSIEIPNSVTNIGYQAFSGCTGLTSITIPNSVTSIGNGAFSYCTGLTSITIPNSVTSIGNQAFIGCTGLTSIEIPSSVTNIGESTFYGCTGLTSIEIPNSVTSIEYRAFSRCTGLEKITVASDNEMYDSRNHCNAIIETATNTLVVGCKNTTIPADIKAIGSGAFHHCKGLTSIIIPNSVTSIGNDAFLGCTGLTNIEIPSSVTSIGESTFYDCTGLTSIEIPSSVTSIGNGAFLGCTGLTSITSYIPLESIIYNAPDFIGLKDFDICTIYVPYGTAWAYEKDMSCKNIVEMEMTSGNLDALYNKVLEYASAIIDDNGFTSHGLITDSTQLSTNAQEKTEGPISNLLDSDIETFFHSSWSSASAPVDGYHYLQIDLGEPLDAIEIKYSKRMNNTMKDYNPEYVEVTATNNVDGEWTLIGNYHWDYHYMTDTVEAGHATYVMGNAYRHVRITVKRAIDSYAHLTTPPFFNLSEFGAWKSVFDASHPTFSGVPAMLMDELQAAMAEAKERLSAKEYSEATFNRLKKAFEEVVEFKTTGVEEVFDESKDERAKSKIIFDLTGRKVENPGKGIYIIDGKKTFIR